jgi:hypothetical protein
MVHGVEFTDIPDFESETRRMPNFTLHELAHAYHDRVLPGGFSNAEIAAAYKAAKKAARSAKIAWHRARVLAREGQAALNKSSKRLAKLKSQSPPKPKAPSGR